MTKPKYVLADTIAGAILLYELSVIHRGELDPRLPAGAIEGLANDTASLRGDAESVVQTRGESKAATQSQAKALAEGVSLTRSLRETISRANPDDHEIEVLFGIGRRLDPGGVQSVAAGLKSLLEGSEQRPEIVRASGILPSDLEEVLATHGVLVGADKFQGKKQLGSKFATAQRNQTHLRVERTMESIVGVANVVFRKRPVILAQFEATLPKRRNARTKQKTETKPEPTQDPA